MRWPGRAVLRGQHLPLHPGGHGGLGASRAACRRPWATSRRWPPRWASWRSGSPPPTRARSRRSRPSTFRRTTTPTRGGDDLLPPGRDHQPLAADRRARHLPGGGPAGLHLPDHGPPGAGRRALPGSPAGQGSPPALQGAAGHHRHPGNGRAGRGGQGHGGARPQDAAVLLPALPCGGAVHRLQGGVRRAEGHHRGVPPHRRRRTRPGLPEQAFYMAGGIEDVERRAAEMAAAQEAAWTELG